MLLKNGIQPNVAKAVLRIRIHPGSKFFGPPGSGSGSISQRYGSGSGSGSFYHQAKIVRKTLIPTALRLLFDFFENDLTVPLKSTVISKKLLNKNQFFCLHRRSMTKIAGSGSASRSGSISQRHGSADSDPDPHQNVMDPQHWTKAYFQVTYSVGRSSILTR